MGLSSSVTLLDSIYQMSLLYPMVAIFSFLFAVAFPFFYTLFVFLLSASELYQIHLPHRSKIIVALHYLDEWYMLDVYFMAVLVALIKLIGMFDLYLLDGFYVLGAVAILILFVDSNYSSNLFEQRKNSLSMPMYGNQKTIILLLTALVFYLPANLFPIMVVTAFNRDEPSTIIQGIVLFFQNKMFFIGIVIFLASILIPIFKILAMFYLLWAPHPTLESCRRKTKLFHFVEKIGKWSMIDIFVICVLSGAVDLGSFFKIDSGSGASFFTLVVILTVFATKTFSIQTIWGQQRIQYENN